MQEVTTGAQVFIGLDLGTSGLKGVAIDGTGQVVGSARHDYPTVRPVPGASEQDPTDWITAIQHVIAELAASIASSTWSGIGLSAMIPTMVVATMDGRPIGPAITWEDDRAQPQGDLLREARGGQALYEQTGQWVDGRYLLPMYMRIADQLGPTEVRVLSAKDWVLHWLTGVFGTDPATATGTGTYELLSGTYSNEILESGCGLVDAPLPKLTPVVSSTTAYPLLQERALGLGLPDGLPIAVGAADAVAAILGLGVDSPGDAVVLAGTSTVIVGISDVARLDPQHRFLVTPLAMRGYGHEMDLLATGSATAWLAELLGLDSPDELAAVGRSVDPGQSGVPIMLGYVAPGEQGALWDPSLTGIIEGMTLHTGAAHLARALLTSITIESTRCLSVWDEHSPSRAVIHVAGRGVDQHTLQELADATGRTTHRCGLADSPHSAVGAALLAAHSIGVQSIRQPHTADLEATPNEAAGAAWQELRHRHDELRLRTSSRT